MTVRLVVVLAAVVVTLGCGGHEEDAVLREEIASLVATVARLKSDVTMLAIESASNKAALDVALSVGHRECGHPDLVWIDANGQVVDGAFALGDGVYWVDENGRVWALDANDWQLGAEGVAGAFEYATPIRPAVVER